jgi:hypothetical protein
VIPSYGAILDTLGARTSGKGWDGHCPLAHRHRDLDRNPSLRLWVGERGELVARCLGCGATWGEIVAATGTAPREWWPQPLDLAPTAGSRRRAVGKVVAVYDYRDAGGGLYAQKLRREPGPAGAAKSFSWRRPLPPDLREKHGVPPGAAAWAWGMEEGPYAPHEGDVRDWRPWRGGGPRPPAAEPLPACPAGLYRLPELLAEPFEHPVCVVEGEKKADLLAALGLCAASGPNGARCWNCDWAEFFADRRVVVIPDNNAAGLGHAAFAAGSLVLAGAAAVKVIRPGDRWPVAEGKDVGDWLAAVPPKERRRELARLFSLFPAFVATRPPLQPAGDS